MPYEKPNMKTLAAKNKTAKCNVSDFLKEEPQNTSTTGSKNDKSTSKGDMEEW